MENINFKDSTIALQCNNNTGKTSVVFVHGNSMSGKIWSKQFESNLSEKYNLIALDLPGHGASGNLSTYNINILAESISAVVEAKSLKNYILVGNSLGGDLILQELSKLKNCKGIVLIDTPPVSKPPAMEKSYLQNSIVGLFFAKDFDEANLNILALSLFHDADSIPDFIKDDFRRTDGKLRLSLAESVGVGNYVDEVEILKNCPLIVAVFSGEKEKLINNEYFFSLELDALWQNKIHLIKDAAHCPQWENASEFNELLDQFIMFAVKH